VSNKLSKLHKYRAFIHEILRLSEFVATSLRRYIYEDIEVKINDKESYIVPKHTTIIGNFGCMARNKDDKFNILKWIDNETGNFNNNNDENLVTTFGFGKRDCVGKTLAIKELYLIIGMLIMKYKFQAPNKDIESFDKVRCRNYLVSHKTTPVQVVKRI